MLCSVSLLKSTPESTCPLPLLAARATLHRMTVRTRSPLRCHKCVRAGCSAAHSCAWVEERAHLLTTISSWEMILTCAQPRACGGTPLTPALGRTRAQEEDEPYIVDAQDTSKHVVVFDPLDGSSNIAASIPTGTIVGVRRSSCQPDKSVSMDAGKNSRGAHAAACSVSAGKLSKAVQVDCGNKP